MFKRLLSPRPDLGLLVIRALVGVVFLFHGSQKLFGLFGGPGISGFAGFLGSLGFPLPTANAVLAGATEFFGGLAVLTGVGTRLISLPLAFTMIVAGLTAHHGFDATQGGMEYPLTLAAVVAGLGLAGPGRYTLLRAFKPAQASETESTRDAPLVGSAH